MTSQNLIDKRWPLASKLVLSESGRDVWVADGKGPREVLSQ
jgi:hypothetical protein